MTSARWWSLPTGIALICIGLLLQPPYPFRDLAFAHDGQISRALFAVSGLVLALLPWHGLTNRRYRSFVAMLAAASCASRAATLIFVSQTTTVATAWQSRVIGIIAWTIIGNLIATVMVATWPPVHQHDHDTDG